MIKTKIAIAIGAALMATTPALAEYDGVIAHIIAKPGQRDALIEAMRPLAGMKGCIDLVVAKDPKNADAIWLTEIWQSKQLHVEATSGDIFTAAMVKIRPMMMSIDQNYETAPVFGTDLKEIH
nr:antibiotic biosynthesis monooxygenase family protein [Sphingomonas sp. CDS-1]